MTVTGLAVVKRSPVSVDEPGPERGTSILLYKNAHLCRTTAIVRVAALQHRLGRPRDRLTRYQPPVAGLNSQLDYTYDHKIVRTWSRYV